MISRWYGLKPKAVELRTKGFSIRKIEHILKIPRSTLSFWFKNIRLTSKQKKLLSKSMKESLVKARKSALLWHHRQKEKRLKSALDHSLGILSRISLDDKAILELSLAMLYLGEGSKSRQTSIGSTNPLILKFFIKCLYLLYDFNPKSIKCELHLRSDQDANDLRKYWSKELNIPISNFRNPNFDKRTIGKPTFSPYKGVCVLQCGKIAIQRKLLFLSEKFCERTVSSVGRASA